MLAITKVALAKSLAKDLPSLPPGKYDVDEVVTVHVIGTVSKAKDVEYTPTVAIPLKTALALLLEKAGVVGPHANRMLVAAMTEALAADVDANEALKARMKDVDVAMEAVAASLGKLPKEKRAGATTVKCEVVVVPALKLAA